MNYSTEKEQRTANSVYVVTANSMVNRRAVLVTSFMLNGQLNASNPALLVWRYHYRISTKASPIINFSIPQAKSCRTANPRTHPKTLRKAQGNKTSRAHQKQNQGGRTKPAQEQSRLQAKALTYP